VGLGLTAAQIRSRFPDDTYVAFHAPRFAVALSHVDILELPEGARILDVGRGALTTMMHEEFEKPVDSMGFAEDCATPEGRHYRFDLNDCQQRERWRLDLPRYDLIVFAEVLEHLHTSPSLVLPYLRELLKPGGRLILQTPNAAVLHNRLKLLMGRNPFERIRESTLEPGHFREYTLAELREYAILAGFEVHDETRMTYFDYRYRFSFETMRSEHTPRSAWVNWLYAILPPAFQRGIMMVLSRPEMPDARA
jgi:2-polyprenyl-3-methyl-5-hydroxy-6-metoxy-1,4-benzoquinol methylase